MNQRAYFRARLRACRGLGAALFLVLATLTAPAGTVSFEGLPSMNNSLSLVPAEARLSNQLAAVSGVNFRTADGSPYVAVVRLGAGHATSGTNGIGGVSAAGSLNYLTTVQANFVLPANPAVPAVVDFVTVRGDSNSIPGTVTLEAFNLAGTSLGSVTSNDARGLLLGITHAGIHSVRIVGSSGTVALDDLTFSDPRPAAGPALIIRPAGSQAEVCWTSLANMLYQLQFTPEILSVNWTDLGDPIVGNGTTNCVLVPVDQTRRFYRLLTAP